MSVLPHKILLRGCLHRAVPAYDVYGGACAKQADIVELNEHLLDQDNLSLYGTCVGPFVNMYTSRHVLFSVWMTSYGIMVVRDPLSEYMMRIWRAIKCWRLRMASGTSNWRSHLEVFSTMTHECPSIMCNTYVPVPGAIGDCLADIHNTFQTMYRQDNMYINYREELKAYADAMASFNEWLNNIGPMFWGLDTPMIRSLSVPQRLSTADHTHITISLRPLELLTMHTFTSELYKCYRETVRGLYNHAVCGTMWKDVHGKTLLEARELPQHVIQWYLSSTSAYHHPGEEKVSMFNFANRGMAIDVNMVHSLATQSYMSWFYIRLLCGLYFVMCNKRL